MGDALDDMSLRAKNVPAPPSATRWAAASRRPASSRGPRSAAGSSEDGAGVPTGDDQGVTHENGPVIQEGQEVGSSSTTCAGRAPEAISSKMHTGGLTTRQRRATMLTMANDASIPFTAGTPETVLPAPLPDAEEALAAALARPVEERRAAVAAVVLPIRPTWTRGATCRTWPATRSRRMRTRCSGTTGASTPCGRGVARVGVHPPATTLQLWVPRGPWRPCGPRPWPSVRLQRRNGADSSCASSTRSGTRPSPTEPGWARS